MTSENVVLNLNTSNLWVPYKGLYSTVFNAIVRKDADAVQDLEVALKKNKPDLINLLKNPPRSPIHRETVKKAATTGIAVMGQPGLQILNQSLIDEALIISDMFDLNEVSALELLIASQYQTPRFPSLTRGLVAMLLYYDGRRNLVNSLQLLVQAREGHTWDFGLTPELSSIVMRFTDQLKEEGIIMKAIDVVEKTNINEELELLHRNRALGGPKYRKQVTDLMKEIKGTLAEVVYNWACQGSLSQEEVMRLLNFLSKHVGIGSDGSMDESTLTLTMAFLYVIDVSTLQLYVDSDVAQKLMFNLLTEKDLCLAIHKQLMNSPREKWQMNGLKAVFQFAWGVTLRTLSQCPTTSTGVNFGDCLEEDEKTVDTAIEDEAFQYLKTLIVKNPIFHEQEFFLKRIHGLITDFIVLMPLKVKDLRNKGDETARIIATHIQAGLEPPPHLSFHFKHLLNLITDLYAKDPSNLDLASEYWCPTDSLLEQSYFQRPSARQIALYKFVRLAGDMLPPPLFVPYHQMLTSLSSSPTSAHNCFVMLKMNGKNGSQGSIVSWDHFFATLHRYYNSLHEEIPANADLRYTYPQRMHTKGIAPQEVQGLIAVLQLISQVVKLDDIARITLSENPQYVPSVVLLGLITCSIPTTLKAALINCLASFASSPDIALNIWQGLEMAQVIPTSMSVYHPSGILMELEEVETRMEEYPVTRAMLNLLDSLLNHPYPPALGSSTRQPGIEPYIQFVRDSVLLRCNSRAYKAESEKWKIMGLCFKILEKVLKSCNFYISPNQNMANSPNVGILILSQMLQDSELLRIVLLILDEGVRILDQYASVPGQSVLEDTTLLALKLIFVTLSKQESFLQQIRESGCDLLVTSLDNLLLNINPRSGQADHLLVIAKYVTYNIFLPQHSLYSISILHGLCSIHISQHLVTVFDNDSKESEHLLKGFVEILEADGCPENDIEEDKMLVARNKARQQLLQLILKCLKHPGPNLSHYLLGFNLRKPIAATEIQDPGVMGSKTTCLHAVIAFLDAGGYAGTYPTNIVTSPSSSELAYKLIFMLCTNRDTSGPTLRYLRSTHDFLFRHLQFLPFKMTETPEVKVLRQQSWLLRTLAVELRITSAHHQRSHVQRLLSCLLDDKPAIESGTGDVSFEPTLSHTTLSSYSFLKPTTGTFRKKLMQILDSITFHHISPVAPHWDYFENEEIERLLKECEVQEVEGPRLIDVELLHSRLSEETVGLKNAPILGQRQIMMQEITKVLQYAVNCNGSLELVYAKKHLFDAWRQVAEVLFIACPLEIVGNEKRDQLVLEISQELLTKMLSADVMAQLMPSASGVILTLMSTLRHSIATALLKPVSQTNNNTVESFPGEPAVVSLTYHSSLLVVLKNVVECLLKTGSGLQRVRANFYSALLNLLCIVQKPYDFQSNHLTGVSTLISDQESEARKLRLEYMETILSYGENFVEIVCRDACTGHDITKMLSLAVLDVAIALDIQQQWLAFLVSKGYLRHILDSLSKDDEELQNLFNRNSSSFRIFYVFDSKMALLTRISCCTNGALALLKNRAIHKLAECRALDLRPDLPSDLKEDTDSWIFPDLLKCYRQMFMAIMRLILSIAMTLGSKHREATLQLLEFVVCNGELFSHVIRDPSNLCSLEALEELSVISAVLSRAQIDDPTALSSDTFLSEQRGHLLLLRQNSLLLLQRLIAVGNTDSNKGDHQESDEVARMKMYRLEITSYIIGSCCSSIVKSGIDVQNSSILFSHHITIASSSESYHLMSSGFEKRLPLVIGRTPDLGLLITLLYRSASEFLSSLDDQKLLSRRLQSLSTLTSDELSEFIPTNLRHSQSSVQQHRELARNSLQKLLQYTDKEISILSYIIESSAFILLKHLEYYFALFSKESAPFSEPGKTIPMRRLQDSVDSTRSSQIPSSPRLADTSLPFPSQFDFEGFKTDVQATLGEPFFRKLKPIEQHLSQGQGHVSFLEAIMNRMKRLVRSQTR